MSKRQNEENNVKTTLKHNSILEKALRHLEFHVKKQHLKDRWRNPHGGYRSVGLKLGVSVHSPRGVTMW